jgi:hypothetical protein
MSTKRPYIFKAALDNLLKRYTEDESWRKLCKNLSFD